MNVRTHLRAGEAGGRIAAAVRAELLRQFPQLDAFEADALARVVRAAEDGHACLELAALRMGRGGVDAETGARMAASLLSSTLVSRAVVSAPDAAPAPFVQEADRVYLRRLWHCESELAQHLRNRATGVETPDETRRASFERVLEGATAAQRLAAAHSRISRLTVVAGGPGTGKTYTAARIVALHAALSGPECRIAVAAPTGKAATRLRQACADVLGEASARLQAGTLHALLRLRPDRAHAGHDPQRPLPLDLLVVDECSMIDLPLFAALLAAVPAHAHLVLIGDPVQLPAIGGGAVFADLATLATTDRAATMAQALACWGVEVASAPRAVHFGDAVVQLRLPVRFDARGELPLALAAVRDGGDAGTVREAISQAGIARLQALPDWRDEDVRAQLRAHWQALSGAGTPDAALEAVDRFRILAGPRLGPGGVAAANRACADALGIADAEAWYHGRPLLITANDARLGLFNGDVGVVLAPPDAPPQAWFRGSDGRARACEPAGLPPHETAYAMTVHKAQGSEFEHAWLLLPEPDSPLLTREWLYTGLSRARTGLTVFGVDAAIDAAVGRRHVRWSGLADRLR
ncbi:MAG TPA: exodeoxyribonuclease V subunit alpha [Xanthomonadaceae bacterium]|nr:exodeoxyribonuclease V subunit alpha [Xanthomonadaceae bacterium]